jgi:hypothetical protein
MSADEVQVTLTHRDYKDGKGHLLTVAVSMRRATVEDLEAERTSPEYRRAHIAKRAKFRAEAGRKYFGGEWPPAKRLKPERISYKIEDVPVHRPSSQSYGNRLRDRGNHG